MLFRRATLFGLVYGAAVTLATIPGAFWYRGVIDGRLRLALLLFAAGALLGGLVSALILGRFGRNGRRSARFAGAILALVLATTGFDILFYFVDYISYYMPYWAPTFTHLWFVSFIFTGLATAFYYMILALPMLLPLGFPVVLVAAYRLSRRQAFR